MTNALITKKLNAIFNQVQFRAMPKMGGTQTLSCNGVSVYKDSRVYYNGRGAKYNTNINHSDETVVITQKMMNDLYRALKLKDKVQAMRYAARTKAGRKNFHGYDFTPYLKNIYGSITEMYINQPSYCENPIELVFYVNGIMQTMGWNDRVAKFCESRNLERK